ncbi:hypothetical protein ES705_38780 [subsurface metagenome]
MLAESDDGTRVYQSPAMKRPFQFFRGFLLGLGGNGPEKACFMLFKQFQGPVRKGIAFLSPEFPAYIGFYIFCCKARGIKDPDCLFKYFATDPVTGHSHDLPGTHLY